MDDRCKDHKHEWFPLFGKSKEYSGYDWCGICGTVRTKAGRRGDRMDFLYKKPDSFKAKLFDINTNGVAPTTKVCTCCNKEKPLSAFGKNRQNLDGLRYHCRSCFSKKYYETEREWKIEYQKKYNIKSNEENKKKAKAKPPEQQEAHLLMQNAVATKQIEKLDYCEVCGVECVTDGHHYDYSKPFDVIWLCRPCHKRIHRLEKEGRVFDINELRLEKAL